MISVNCAMDDGGLFRKKRQMITGEADPALPYSLKGVFYDKF